MTKELCLIGAGRIARVHARSLSTMTGVRIASVVDPSQGAGQVMATAVGADWHTSLGAACGVRRFDGVIIAAPTSLHGALIEECISRDLPVFCEKPVDLSLERVDLCLELVEKSGVPVLVGFHRRFDADRQDLHRLAASGALGAIEHILQISRDPRLPAEGFIAHSGGIVRDMIIHDLDELVWLCGQGEVSVQADLRRLIDPGMLAKYDDFDTAAITIVFESGPQCQISASRRCVYGFDQRLEVFGSLGLGICPSVPASRITMAIAEGFLAPPLLDHFPQRYASAYAAEMSHFMEIIEGGAKPLCTVADARASLALAQLVLEAARSGTTVRGELH